MESKPKFIPEKTKMTPSQKKGITYEKKVAAYLEKLFGYKVKYGKWIEYIDCKGLGWCQPDILIVPRSKKRPIVIIECKLTATSRAKHKLLYTYKPVIENIYPDRDVRLVQVCKNLTKDIKDLLLNDIRDIEADEVEWKFSTCQIKTIPR
jgi:hypothetical protein